MAKVWILSHHEYDSYTIIGIYTTQERAESERDRLEALQREHNSFLMKMSSSRRELRERTALSIQEQELDETLATVSVRMRKDGEVVETHVFLGDRYHGMERIYDGRASTYEDAVKLAEKAIQEDRN